MKHIKLAHSYESGYTLLVRLNDEEKLLECCPFVVAWCYSEEKQDWLAGHYFDDINEAVQYFISTYVNRYHRS